MTPLYSDMMIRNTKVTWKFQVVTKTSFAFRKSKSGLSTKSTLHWEWMVKFCWVHNCNGRKWMGRWWCKRVC